MQLTAEEHFENAEMAFTMENFDLARTSFKRALDMEPEVGGASHALKKRAWACLPRAAALALCCRRAAYAAMPPVELHTCVSALASAGAVRLAAARARCTAAVV